MGLMRLIKLTWIYYICLFTKYDSLAVETVSSGDPFGSLRGFQGAMDSYLVYICWWSSSPPNMHASLIKGGAISGGRHAQKINKVETAQCRIITLIHLYLS